ncbi:hypothetical protein AVEN_21410-1 [Araneus ventricosus]|uniref:DUF4371 domain-containing protein n=1 Tax=Araneus ventricosus TaxID=182803 RepID=A0A4Y2JSS0_ARAVE|nr:hypothetical protein AVEN_21410-1 [Araneus ventricosus]
MGPKRSSGSDFRKIKKQKGEENKKLGNWHINEEQVEQNMLEAGQIDSTMLQEQDSETVSEESSNSEIASTEVVTNSDERNDSERSYFTRASCSADLDEEQPLRECSDAIGDNNCGVFLSTLELISRYNLQLFQHIENIKSKKHVPNYFSPKIQNEVIGSLGNKVRSEILNKVKRAKYSSIIFDCTPDTAHIEQMSQIIRYVNIKDGECSVEKSFVDFVISHQKTGRNLSEEIMQKLSSDGLDIQNCRGQGFDNGSNMAGKYEGVQAHIFKINYLTKFVPCAAYILNLVGVHAAEVSVLMISFFGKVLEFFNFFSISTLRWEALLDCIKTSLKRHCDTRWSSRRQAVTALQENLLPSVHKVLQHVTDRANNWTTDTASDAMILLR